MKIFIDPGHGGNDPGAIGAKGTKESNVVLDAALALKNVLEKAGIETELSRNIDKTMSLASRAEKANRAKVDLFVSIHCNGFANSNANGTEVFSYPGDAEGAKLSKMILDNLCENLKTASRGTKTENFAVLRLTEMPAVLIETAFITNPTEESLMLEEGFSDKFAEAVAKGIFEYLGYDNTNEHWGKQHLESLMGKGYINSPETWRSFDDSPTNAMVLALVDKITEEK